MKNRNRKSIISLILSASLVLCASCAPALASEDQTEAFTEPAQEETVTGTADALEDPAAEVPAGDLLTVPSAGAEETEADEESAVQDSADVIVADEIVADEGAEAESTDEFLQDAILTDSAEEEALYAAAGESVRYVDAKGNEQEPEECTPIAENSKDLQSGWYAVTENVELSNRMMINGDVNLILCDGTTLTAGTGIGVGDSASLTIWAQSTDESTMGRLDATLKTETHSAAIGGNQDSAAGTIIINGGNVNADASAGRSGAGIGGGSGTDSSADGGSVTIAGGRVTAKGGSDGGAGIGGGYNRNSGEIVISGGDVEATGISGAAGIGGGSKGEGINLTISGGTVKAVSNSVGPGIGSGGSFTDAWGSVTITGGTVTAAGGRSSNGYCGAGIGAGYAGNAKDLFVKISGGSVNVEAYGEAAGIGGGAEEDSIIWSRGGEGANVDISGGVVVINTEHTAIGHGGNDSVMGELTIGKYMKVQAGNNGTSYERTFTAAERVPACNYRRCARIEACTHPDNTYNMDTMQHQKYCAYCDWINVWEDHVADENDVDVCSVCGYRRQKTSLQQGKDGKETAGTEASAGEVHILLVKMKTSGEKALVLTWTKMPGAEGYDIFFGPCDGKKKIPKAASVSADKKLRYKAGGLEEGANYRSYVKAWKKADGKKTYIGKASPVVHAIAGGFTENRTDAKKVTAKPSKITLKAGKSKTIKATVKGEKAGLKLMDHAKQLRFYSSDSNVASVSSKGKVKAKNPGTCTIYVLANNGVRAAVKVTVK